jgi:CHAT domain-containing protein
MGITDSWQNLTNNLAAKATDIIFQLSAVATPVTHRNFLLETLEAIAQSSDNLEYPYSLIRQNSDKLDRNFCFVLYALRDSTLNNAEPEEAFTLAAALVTFGDLVLELPQGNSADRVEIAIASYNLANIVYDRFESTTNFAIVEMRLAQAYNIRGYGNSEENQQLAQNLYNRASEVLQTQSPTAQERNFSEETIEVAYTFITNILNEIFQGIFEILSSAGALNPEAAFDAIPSPDWAYAQGNNLQQRINPLLDANVHIINDDFPFLLEQWTVATLEAVDESYREMLPFVLGMFGDLLIKYPRGTQANNIDTAIACYQIASTIYTPETNLESWIGFQVALLTAYRTRIRGDKKDNLELAISYGERALRQCTRPEHRREIVLKELAAAYRNRIEGDPIENCQRAINYFDQALPPLERVAPKEWARTKMNQGNVYIDIHRLISNEENSSVNLEEIFRLAIDCYQAALSKLKRDEDPYEWGLINSNLGSFYLEIKDNIPANRQQAISYFELASRVYRRQIFPYDWAATKYSLGLAYRDLHQLTQAIDYFELALKVFQPANHPPECLRAGRNLGNAAFKLGHWEKAIQGYKPAIEALEQRRTWATSESRRLEITEASIDIYANMVQACVNNDQLERAVEYAERSRSKRIVDLMESNDLYSGGEIPPRIQELLQNYEYLQQQIIRLRSSLSHQNTDIENKLRNTKAQETINQELQNLEAQKQDIWELIRSLDPVLAGQKQVEPLNFKQIQELIETDTTAILNFFTTDSDTHIFILFKDTNPIIHTCSGQGLDTLQSWIFENWLELYEREKQRQNSSTNNQWEERMFPFLSELSQRLQLNDLIDNYLSEIEELIIVPHLSLHQIPFAALPLTVSSLTSNPSLPQTNRNLDNNLRISGGKRKTQSAVEIFSNTQYLSDRFEERIIPSCQILKYCHERPRSSDKLTMGIVEDATSDLIFTSFECDTLAKLQSTPPQRLKRQEATVENYRKLAQQVEIIHSSHHAGANLSNPLDSALKLANGFVTLGQLLSPGWRSPNLYEVFCSCCETSLTNPTIADDVITFGTGFLCAGARNVISTLWAVDDLATSLFCIFYYEFRKEKSSRSQALQQAQLKLRQLTGEELKIEYGSLIERYIEQNYTEKIAELKLAQSQMTENKVEESQSSQQIDIEEIINNFENQLQEQKKRSRILYLSKFPFAHPKYWSAFITQGLS